MHEWLENKKVVAIIDTFFGDSGKGKIIDYLASLTSNNKPLFPYVYRPNGGPNTGHTIEVNNKKYIFHLIPSAALIKEIKCFIGKAVTFEPRTFFEELEIISKANPDVKIYIDQDTHVIMPWHTALDNLREITNSKTKIGTTGRGVGPCMETKCSRKGFVTVGMLNNEEELKIRINEAAIKLNPELKDLKERFNENKELLIQYKSFDHYLNTIKLPTGITLSKFFIDGEIDVDFTLREYKDYGKKLENLIVNVIPFLRSELNNNKRILVEGTQGVFLDMQHGTYPYVTAGLTTRAGLEHHAGIFFDLVINVVKAYGTRVGNGPFTTEILDLELSKKLRDSGNEYGSTTGRPRRVGWLDLDALKLAFELNMREDEIPLIALTKLDVLEGFEPQIISKEGSVIFDKLESINGIKSLEDLPKNSKTYVKYIEEQTNSKIVLIGNGASREQIITEYNKVIAY